MVTFRTEDFWTNIGGTAYEWNRNIRDAIATYGCELWNNYPKWTTLDNPLNAFVRGYLNAACAPIGLDVPAPEVPFVGGQCDTAYHVTGKYKNANTGGAFGCEEELVFSTTLNNAPTSGRVTRVGTRPFGNDTVLAIYYFSTSNNMELNTTPGGNISGNPVFVRPACANITPNNQGNYMIAGSAYIESVTRVDGQPDNCGSLPVEYPDVTPTSQDLTKTIIINNNDGLSTTHNLVYNQIAPNYNFPFGFKLDGVNAT